MFNKDKAKQIKKQQRIIRGRREFMGTIERPRLAVTKSNRGFWLQLVDDSGGRTLVSASLKDLPNFKGTKVEAAKKLGEIIAAKAAAKDITQIIFDRRGNRYHGRVQAVAAGARQGGLKF